MTKDETLKLLKKQVERWKYMVLHYGWKFDVYYHDSAEDMPEDATINCCAYTRADFEYLQASIHINLRKCQDLDKDTIEYIIVHELVHLLISPLRENSDSTPTIYTNLEYTVTTIAQIIKGLRKD